MLIVIVAALLGIWRFRSKDYFRWLAILCLWVVAGSLLFAGGGTLQDPQGDGLITRQVRIAAGDGIGMGLFAIGFIIVYWGGILFLVTRLVAAARAVARLQDSEGAEGERYADVDPTPRQAAETGLVLLLAGGWLYLTFAAPANAPASAQAPGRLMDANAAADAASAPAESEVEAALKQAADEMNAGPRQLDDSTTLLRTVAAGRTLTYHYEVQMRGQGREDLRRFVEANVVPKVCAGDQRPSMRDHGVSYIYDYSSPDLAEPVVVTVTEQTCRRLEG